MKSLSNEIGRTRRPTPVENRRLVGLGNALKAFGVASLALYGKRHVQEYPRIVDV